MEQEYYQVDGTSFTEKTPRDLAQIVAGLVHTDRRVRLFLGDAITGEDWGEENDVTGTIGRSMGPTRIPLLIHSRRSLGGGAILTDCIIRLQTTSGRVLWQNPKFTMPVYSIGEPPARIGNSDMRGYTTGVYQNGENVANFKSESAALRWIKFMTGQRACK